MSRMPVRIRPTRSVYIIKRKSGIHGSGIYARQDIPKGTSIIEYVGERITKPESLLRADIQLNAGRENESYGAVYIFELNKRHDIDGNVYYNTARFINHSCTPNCEAEISRGRIWIISLRVIKKGEELTYNYGYDLDSYEDHLCRCQAANCAGYIVAREHWPKLKRLLKKKKSGVSCEEMIHW